MNITLEAHTNSDRDIPSGILVDTAELDALIAQYTNVNSDDDAILSVEVSTLPTGTFVDEEGEEWDSDEAWDQTSTKVSKNGLALIFVHNQTGHELFFEYFS